MANGLLLRAEGQSPVNPRSTDGQGTVRVWFGYGSGMVRVWFRYGSGIMHISLYELGVFKKVCQNEKCQFVLPFVPP